MPSSGQLHSHLASLGHVDFSVRRTDGVFSVVDLEGNALPVVQAVLDAWVPTREEKISLQEALVLLANDSTDADAKAVVSKAATKIKAKL